MVLDPSPPPLVRRTIQATRMNESSHTKWILSHTWVMPHTWVTNSHFAFIITPVTWMIHGTRMNESCHTHASCHTHESCHTAKSRTHISLLSPPPVISASSSLHTHINENASCHACERVTSPLWMRHVACRTKNSRNTSDVEIRWLETSGYRPQLTHYWCKS